MKAFLIGIFAILLATPAMGGTVPAADAVEKKFGTSVQLNYTRAVGRGASAYRGGYYGRGAYGYYRGGYGRRYPYYGFGYPYFGYYGFPYAAGFGYGLGLPYGYYGGYYAGAYAPAPGYYAAPPRVAYYGSVRTGSSGRGSSAPSLVSQVQSSLKNRGFYAGGVDGNFGPESQHALAAFQTSNGLPPTGTLDTPTLHALGVGVKPAKVQASTASRPVAPPPRPTTESTFVPPPIGTPVAPPGIPTESAPAPTEPAPATPAQ